jgi:hypothetical protein
MHGCPLPIIICSSPERYYRTRCSFKMLILDLPKELLAGVLYLLDPATLVVVESVRIPDHSILEVSKSMGNDVGLSRHSSPSASGSVSKPYKTLLFVGLGRQSQLDAGRFATELSTVCTRARLE